MTGRRARRCQGVRHRSSRGEDNTSSFATVATAFDGAQLWVAWYVVVAAEGDLQVGEVSGVQVGHLRASLVVVVVGWSRPFGSLSWGAWPGARAWPGLQRKGKAVYTAGTAQTSMGGRCVASSIP